MRSSRRQFVPSLTAEAEAPIVIVSVELSTETINGIPMVLAQVRKDGHEILKTWSVDAMEGATHVVDVVRRAAFRRRFELHVTAADRATEGAAAIIRQLEGASLPALDLRPLRRPFNSRGT